MNIGLMLKAMNGRVKSEEFEMIPVDNMPLFKSKNDWITDFLLLSSIWNNIEPQDQVFICNQLIGKRQCRDLMLLLRWMNENKDIDDFNIMVALDTWSKDDDYSVDIRPNRGQEWINIITVTHRPTVKSRWKECRNTYPNEENDIIEMLISALKMEIEL